MNDTAISAPFEQSALKTVSVWLPLYIGDFFAETHRFTTRQRGAYALMMADYWHRPRPPYSDSILQQITGLTPCAWRQDKDVLLGCFEIQNDRLIHPRWEELLREAIAQRTSYSERGRKGAQARWAGRSKGEPKQPSSNSRGSASANACGMRKEHPSPSPSPTPIEQHADQADAKPIGALIGDLRLRIPTDEEERDRGRRGH